MPRVAGKDSDSKARILEAARDIFAKKGYSGTSIRDIAGASGMSNPTIYYHYPSKEGILLALLEEAYVTLQEELSRVLETAGDPLTRFRLLLETHLRLTKDLRATVNIFNVAEYEDLSAETVAYSRRLQRGIVDIYRNELEPLQEAGLLRTSEITILAFNISACINWLLRWYHEGGPVPFDRICSEIVEFVLHGMLAVPEGSA